MAAKVPITIFDKFNNEIKSEFSNLKDIRKGRNTQYSMHDIAMGAYSVFYMQSPSFLEHQRQMQAQGNSNNLVNLFLCQKIATDNHIRTVLDEVPASSLNRVFLYGYKLLESEGYLEGYRCKELDNNYLIANDGTQFYMSQKIKCNNCGVTKHRNGKIDYHHKALLSALVHPDQKEAVPLIPEYIIPQDGHIKQDCEHSAAKRWISGSSNLYNFDKVTLLGDDLYSDHNMCKGVLAAGYNFIYVCKQTTHKILYDHLEQAALGEKILFFSKDQIAKKRISKKPKKSIEKRHYRYYNNVPIRGTKDALLVNWCDVTISDAQTGEVINYFSYITNHAITHDNVEVIISAGRAKWKIENENNNTLKTKGYNLEHNYGHGKKHLASTLVTLNLLAFLCHTIQSFTDEFYITIRKKLSSRKKFFNGIRELTTYLIFTSMQELLNFMLNGLERKHSPPNALIS